MSCLKPDMFDLVSKPIGPAATKEKTDTRDGLINRLLHDDGAITAARRNFIGVLQFYLEGPLKALECFQQVLDADPDNINAIQNCIFVYRKMMKDYDVKRLGNRLRDLLSERGTSKQKEVTARFYAELGYVMSFKFCYDRNGTVTDFKRLQSAVRFFEEALDQNISDVFSVQELCQWHFFAARSCNQLYDCYLRTSTQLSEEDLHRIVRAVHSLLFVVQEADSDTLKSKVFCQLGTLMFKMQRTKNFLYTRLSNNCIEACGLNSEYRDPALCFQAASDLCAQNAQQKCKLARMFLGRNFRDLPQAIELLNQSIQMDPSAANWLAFSSRGQAYKHLYKQRNHKGKPSSGNFTSCSFVTPPNRELDLLLSAAKDFETVLGFMKQLEASIDLGSVYHLLGRAHASCNKPLSREMMDKALGHFTQAVESLEGKKCSYLYLQRAHCLRDCGEVRHAIESYKAAMDCDETHSGDVFSMAFRGLITLLLQLCNEERLAQNLVSEVAFWFHDAVRNCRSKKIPYAVDECCRDYAPEMVAVCRELLKMQHNGTARLLLSTLHSTRKKIIKCYENNGKADKLSDAIEELKAVEKMINLLPAVEENQSDSAKPVVTVQMSNVSVPGGRDSVAHPLETARNAKKKNFDFSVLYSDDDEDWVLDTLIPKLEGDHRFKGFFRYRDILAGEPDTVDQVGVIVKETVCSVAVLSNAFLKDRLRRRMLRLIFDETVEDEDEHPIVLLRLSNCEIPEDLARRSTLPVIDSCDWHQLVTRLQKLGQR